MNVFATGTHTARLFEAEGIIDDRMAEAAEIAAHLATEDDEFLREILSLRLLALTNHIDGWAEYIHQGCPREPRAQVDRTYYRRRPAANIKED